MKRPNSQSTTNTKLNQLSSSYVPHDNGKLTTNQGVGIPNTEQTLRAGDRGPTLMEDFIFREKITHFDHERIPERIVHARGFGAHGTFKVYKSLSDITKAHFLSDPDLETPVFVRFSTVAGFRGSPDTVRDVRGFAVKFYTQEGNYDIVGNNMPVFFIQDAIKFPDLIHALKPEPHNEIPQAQSAHDTFWDFVAANRESAHNVMWLMSDRAIPRSYRMMEGFAIHTFKFVNKKGDFKFVKLHWKPLLGVHSLVWDETQKIAGKDPDFNRRDLWEAIENGNYPEWELGIQVLDPKEEFKFDFDILDCTKLWPEELVPVERIGKMTLNHNVTNYFAETEQAAFCPANLVPGIDLTNDPMLQGRLFSYLDTQLSRLGGPNFHQIPINAPVVPVNNNQRDGIHRMTVDMGISSYYRNAIQNGQPHPAHADESYFENSPSPVEGRVVRDRSRSFMDFYSQPKLFWNSMAPHERQHIIDAFRFELGKVQNTAIRQSVVDMFGNVDLELATQIALGIGALPPKNATPSKEAFVSPALSMAGTVKSPVTRKVAVLLENGFAKKDLTEICNALNQAGACYHIVAPVLGLMHAQDGFQAEANQTFATAASVLYDAVYLPGGAHTANFMGNGDCIHFIQEAFKHLKPIAALGSAVDLVAKCGFSETSLSDEKTGKLINDKGVLTQRNTAKLTDFATVFVQNIAAARFWMRGALIGATPA